MRGSCTASAQAPRHTPPGAEGPRFRCPPRASVGAAEPGSPAIECGARALHLADGCGARDLRLALSLDACGWLLHPLPSLLVLFKVCHNISPEHLDSSAGVHAASATRPVVMNCPRYRRIVARNWQPYSCRDAIYTAPPAGASVREPYHAFELRDNNGVWALGFVSTLWRSSLPWSDQLADDR
jgi:hypothetical protein